MEFLENLAVCLSKLPGIGRRSAERMALKLVREPDGLMTRLIAALDAAREHVCCCSQCGNVTSTDADPCRLCTDPMRDGTVLCVVEDPADIVLVERAGGFDGRYHSLMGKLSPMSGEGPADLTLKKLLKRIDSEGVREVILAVSTSVEGDATASFLGDLLKDRSVAVSRLAFGLPAGSGIRYSDPVTLSRAISGRTQV